MNTRRKHFSILGISHNLIKKPKQLQRFYLQNQEILLIDHEHLLRPKKEKEKKEKEKKKRNLKTPATIEQEPLSDLRLFFVVYSFFSLLNCLFPAEHIASK